MDQLVLPLAGPEEDSPAETVWFGIEPSQASLSSSMGARRHRDDRNRDLDQTERVHSSTSGIRCAVDQLKVSSRGGTT